MKILVCIITSLQFLGMKVLGSHSWEAKVPRVWKIHGAKVLGPFAPRSMERRFSMWTFCSQERQFWAMKSPDTASLALSYFSPCRWPDFLSLKSQAFCVYFSFYSVISFFMFLRILFVAYLLLYPGKDPFLYKPLKKPSLDCFIIQSADVAVGCAFSGFFGYKSSSFKLRG